LEEVDGLSELSYTSLTFLVNTPKWAPKKAHFFILLQIRNHKD